MHDQIKVSVIIPVYNVEKYLRKCLDSVRTQSLKEREIICVDDGSSDSSLAILREYEKKDPQLSVLTQTNRFAGVARNAGLEAAKGKYVVFWDSDDFFEKKALETMYRRCEQTKAQICVCDAFRMDNQTGIVSSDGCYLVREQMKKLGNSVFSKLDQPEYIFTFANNAPWNKMYLRSFLLEKKLQFQALPQANDLYFVMAAFYLADRITVVDRPLMTYRMDNSLSLTGKASRYAGCAAQALEAVWQILVQADESDERVMQSFANKAWLVLLASLRQQSDIEQYKELFGLYRDTLVPRYGISGHEPGYIFHEGRERALQAMLACSCEQFLLTEMREFERQSRLAEWKVKASASFRVGNAIVRPAGRVARRIRTKIHQE